MTTIAPATPLPWSVSHPHSGRLLSLLRQSDEDFNKFAPLTGIHADPQMRRDRERAKKDEAYRLHAANAYPELVEDRRKLVEALQKTNDALKLSLARSGHHYGDSPILENIDLLRSLGEGKGK